MEISLGTLKKIGVMFLAFLLVLFLASIFLPYVIPAKVEPTPTPTVSPVGEVGTKQNIAATFAAALYTIDYNNESAWLANYSQHPFYTMFDMVLKPGIWKTFFDNFTKTTATVKKAELFYEEKSEPNGQLWKIDLTLDKPWPASPLQPSNPKSMIGFPWPNGTEVTVYVFVSKNMNTSNWEIYSVLEQAQAENMKAGGN